MGDLDRMFEDMDNWFWGPSFALTPRMAAEGMRIPRINVKDGMLTVSLMKAQEAKPKRHSIAVK